jgi:hypothetical protein
MSHFGNHVVRIVVAVGAGKDQYPEFHGSRVAASDRDDARIQAGAIALGALQNCDFLGGVRIKETSIPGDPWHDWPIEVGTG